MPKPAAVRTLDLSAVPDSELVELARRRHPEAFRCIMQRHNRRLYRAARALLRDASEAEDVVQETYFRAFTALETFRADSSLSTWLTRIALNEALGRLRQRRPTVDLETLDTSEERNRMQVIPFPLMKSDADPEQTVAQHEIRRLLERAIDGLPEHFRLVFVMRDVEEMSIEETAAHLDLRPETVRTRLHRARAQLRDSLKAELTSALTDTFPFGGDRCARISDAVLQRLQNLELSHPEQENNP